MNGWKRLLGALLLVVSISAAGQVADANSAAEREADKQLEQGATLSYEGKPAQALPYLKKAAVLYEQQFNDPKVRYYSARTRQETLAYLSAAAVSKQNARVTSAYWAYAYYLQAYALIDVMQIDEAKPLLQRALTLSPSNAQFRSELGHVYQIEKNWPLALSTFAQAAKDAQAYSPPKNRNNELSRAWRGQGYALVEMNRLDEAEKIYLRCLALDKNDSKAAGELEYVRQQKAKK